MVKIEISANLGENFYDPEKFVDATIYAERMGFRTAWFGDHFYPWYHSAKRSSFIWSVMSVALEKTDKIKVGPWVTVPTGARYHPAIIAQATATIDNMYPGRIQLAVGTGEALNERPFWNDNWPKWNERMERLTEGIKLIRQMWDATEPFRFEGKYFSSDFYYLYTKPRRKIPIYCSAIGKRAAHEAGLYGDGLVTISPRNDLQALQEEILPAYKTGRTEANKTGLGKIAVELVYSFDKPQDVMRKEWRSLGILRKDSWSIANPVAVEEEGKKATIDEVKRSIQFCKNWDELVELIQQYQDIGVTEISIGTSCDKKLIREVAKNVLNSF